MEDVVDPRMKFDERRKERRFPIQTNASIRVSKGTESANGTTVNVSAGGAQVYLDTPLQLNLGDQVVCQIDLPDDLEEPLSSWAIAHVVRIDGNLIAIQMEGGEFAAPHE